MFYAHFVLAKKGPLARIWLAAHWDKKLTKAHVFETNIESSVEGILQPKVKMALRTSGHLLLGIVRIYSRKAKYLLADCNEAFIKIKMAFRPGAVDLPEENRQAHVNAITLPEVFHDFETGMPDLNNIDMEAAVTLNQSRAEDITLKEDYGNISLMHDDGFGDMGFEDAEMGRDVSNIDEAFDFGNTRLTNASVAPECSSTELPPEAEKRDFGALGPDDTMLAGSNEGGEGGSIFEPAGLFVDAPLASVPSMETSVRQEVPRAPENESDDDDDMYDMGPPSMGGPSSPESEPEAEPPAPPPPPPPIDFPEPTVSAPADQTTLLQNEEESFALAPLDATLVQGLERAKAKRKRKLIVDEVKNISGEEMKAQLSDTTDIVTTLDLAPPTKRLMHWKETGGVEKLFALPGRPILSRNLSKLYQRHLTTKAVENEDFVGGGEEEEESVVPPAVAGSQLPVGNEAKRPRLDNDQYDMVAANAGYPPPPPDSYHLPQTAPEYPPVDGGWGQEYGFPGSVPPPPPPPTQHLGMDYGSPYQLGPPSNMMGAPHTPSVSAQDQQPMFPPMEPEPMPDYHTHQPPSVGMLPPTPGMHPPPTPGMMSPPQEQQPLPAPPTPMMQVLPPPPATPTQGIADDFDSLVGPSQGYSDSIPAAQPLPQHEEQQQQQHQQQQQQAQEHHTDDDDDYGAPASVGPVDEQQADETYEQFEERILTKRTVHMLHLIRTPLENGRRVRFSDVARNNLRKQVAQKFYTFLVLKKQQAVELIQEAPYAELYVEKGPRYEQSL